jgi:hypothetical protein
MWRGGNTIAPASDIHVSPIVDVHVSPAVAHIGAIDARRGANRSVYDAIALRTRNVRGLHVAGRTAHPVDH